MIILKDNEIVDCVVLDDTFKSFDLEDSVYQIQISSNQKKSHWMYLVEMVLNLNGQEALEYFATTIITIDNPEPITIECSDANIKLDNLAKIERVFPIHTVYFSSFVFGVIFCLFLFFVVTSFISKAYLITFIFSVCSLFPFFLLTYVWKKRDKNQIKKY